MAVSGTINVNLSAIDTAVSEGVEAEKKAAVSSAVNLESAVVAVASGTCGTTTVSLSPPFGYRGADGELVTEEFSLKDSTLRLAFVAEPEARLEIQGRMVITSRNSEVCISSMPITFLPSTPVEVKTVASLGNPNPTASFTVVLIKEA